VSPDRLNDFDKKRSDVGKEGDSNFMSVALKIWCVEAKYFTTTRK
jgi:hypothetical protein